MSRPSYGKLILILGGCLFLGILVAGLVKSVLLNVQFAQTIGKQSRTIAVQNEEIRVLFLDQYPAIEVLQQLCREDETGQLMATPSISCDEVLRLDPMFRAKIYSGQAEYAQIWFPSFLAYWAVRSVNKSVALAYILMPLPEKVLRLCFL